jgi:hypothetical protein
MPLRRSVRLASLRPICPPLSSTSLSVPSLPSPPPPIVPPSPDRSPPPLLPPPALLPPPHELSSPSLEVSSPPATAAEKEGKDDAVDLLTVDQRVSRRPHHYLPHLTTAQRHEVALLYINEGKSAKEISQVFHSRGIPLPISSVYSIIRTLRLKGRLELLHHHSIRVLYAVDSRRGAMASF